MRLVRRLPMLGRLAARYAGRHRAQTVRAVLGLLVVALILTTGLGLGDSLGASLEQSVDTRFGPVEVIVRGPPLFNESVADAVLADPAVQAAGARGVPTLLVVGSAGNPARGRAEAFASLRGIHPGEATALGPLPGGAREPGPGEVVLAQDLATRLEAQPGDRLELRVLPTDLEAFGLQSRTIPGNATPDGTQVRFAVGADVLALLVEVAANGTVEARLADPDGREHPFAREPGFLEARVLGLVPPGNWTLQVRADATVPFEATVRTGSAPPDVARLVRLVNATVAAVVPAEGRGALTPRPGALMPRDDLQAALGMEGKASHLYLGTEGDPRAAAAAVRQALGPGEWHTNATKLEALERIRTDAAQLTGFILVMGGFTIVASILLAYLLFSSLVEERRVELGIARAVGVTRMEVAATMVLEALLYAGLAALAGLLLGLALLSALLPIIDSYSQELGGPHFFLAIEPASVATAFAGGVLLPVLTIALGSARFARLDPARAIRGAPDDVRVRHRPVRVAAAAVALLGLALLALPLWRLLGPPLVAAGATIFLLGARRRGWAAAAAALGILHAAWTLYTFDGFPQRRRDLDPVLTLLRALAITLLLAALAACSPAPFRAVGRVAGRLRGLRRAATMATAYLAARRAQVGLTAAMVAVVAVIVTVTGTLAAIFGGSIPTHEGGYEVVGQSPFPLTTFPRPLPAELAAEVERADFLPVHSTLGGGGIRVDGEPFRGGRGVRLAGATPGFAQATGLGMRELASGYASDAQAWQAVAAGEAVVAPPWLFDPGELRLGGTLQVGGGRDARNYTVAGMLQDARRGHLFVAHDDVRSMGFPQSALVYVRVADGADADAVAHRLTEAYQREGLAFESVAEEAAQAADLLQATVLVMQAFLFLGVLVGVSSTGFLASRAVHERMRETGTLRAVGYEPADVGRAFVLESTLVCALGLAVGLAVGALVAHSIWWRTIRETGTPFGLPWAMLALFAAGVLALTALASWWPARRAARLDPALALRHVE
jgi:putative ABC transport system permease protein